jgi:hypothetical protein
MRLLRISQVLQWDSLLVYENVRPSICLHFSARRPSIRSAGEYNESNESRQGHV